MDNTQLQELAGDDWLNPDEILPSELMLNDDHPDRDQFSQDCRDVERQIYAFGRMMKPKRRELSRLLRTHMKPPQIAKKLGVSLDSIYRWCKRPDVIRLTTLLDYQQRLVDGATASHRKAVLWRVALDNEQQRPNITIQAVQEINRMSGAYQDAGNGNTNNVVNIQINGELLPRGNLDTLPETFENRKAIEGKVVSE